MSEGADGGGAGGAGGGGVHEAGAGGAGGRGGGAGAGGGGGPAGGAGAAGGGPGAAAGAVDARSNGAATGGSEGAKADEAKGAGGQDSGAAPPDGSGVGDGRGGTPGSSTEINADHDEEDGGAPADAERVLQGLRRATSMYVGGDQVGGNKYVFVVGDRQSAPLHELDPALSEPVQRAFVAPEDWDRTRATAGNRPLILLRGQPGHGRVAAAIRLLQTPSDRRIYSLDRDVDLQRFPHWLDGDAAKDNALPLDAGFLLCNPSGKAPLKGGLLHDLAATLDQRDARMVITVDADLVPAGDEVGDFVVALGRHPPHAAVLREHLRWRLGKRPDTDAGAVDRILAENDMCAFLRDTMTDDAPVKVAANLAMMIDQQFDGIAVDMPRLRQQQAERVIEDFDIWFGALPDVRTRSMAIALAVLNGLPYEHVARAARRLSDALDGPPQIVAPETPMLRPPWRDPFGTTLRQQLRLLRAHTREETTHGTFGPTVIEVVEYLDDERPRTVLKHVWQQYQLQRPVLDWLTGFATEAHQDVRTYAGTALGVLTTYAFDFVYANALQDMSTDDNPWARDMVAYALRLPARDEKLFPLVRRVANRLHGNPEPLARATSARIRGLALGPLGLSGALQMLGFLALVNDWRVARAIAESLADLLVDDEDKHGPDVLRHVVAWQDDRRRTLAGQYIFSELADGVIARVDMTEPDATRPEWHVWPGLLLLADRRRELRPLLVKAWARVLNSDAIPGKASDALDNWAGLAESYPHVRTAFVRLMAATAATSARTQSIILRHAYRWHAPDEVFPNPETAAAVETALTARNDAP
jgi:hypothetical protein